MTRINTMERWCDRATRSTSETASVGIQGIGPGIGGGAGLGPGWAPTRRFVLGFEAPLRCLMPLRRSSMRWLLAGGCAQYTSYAKINKHTCNMLDILSTESE